MLKITNSSFVTAALVATLTVSGSVNAGPSNAPFKATVSTTETLTPTGDPSCPLAGMTTGLGNASHLGKVLLTATDCVTPGPAGFQFSGGKLTLAAANGDTLNAVYSGSFIPTGQGMVFLINNASFQIVGGTGRFAGAFGRGELHGTEDISTIPATGQLDVTGTISYPNGK